MHIRTFEPFGREAGDDCRSPTMPNEFPKSGSGSAQRGRESEWKFLLKSIPVEFIGLPRALGWRCSLRLVTSRLAEDPGRHG